MNVPDPRNQDIVVFINGELVPRQEARVSVFDSVVQGGDAVWEGLRVYDGRIAALDGHLQRLQDSAKALAFDAVPSSDDVRDAIFRTLAANGMCDESHIRLTLTRGEKTTSGMNPRFNQSGCTLIVLAEWKPPVYSNAGIRVITASTRRNTPQCLDSKIHHNNLLNNILASIEANVAGVDSAIMLDVHGFVSETNDTNLFIVRDGIVSTPHADSCLPGLTRKMILQICGENAIVANVPVPDPQVRAANGEIEAFFACMKLVVDARQLFHPLVKLALQLHATRHVLPARQETDNITKLVANRLVPHVEESRRAW